MITSVDNPRVKDVLRLRRSRERRSSGLFVVEGLREVERARAAGLRFRATYWSPELLPDAAHLGGDEVSARVLHHMAYRGEPEGVVAVVEAPEHALPADASLVLVAVGVEKPGNLGAMARSAEAAGADALLVAEGAFDPWNPNAIRASTGAVFTLPIVASSLDELRALPLRRVAAVVGAPTRYTRRRPARADRADRRRRGPGPRRALASCRRRHRVDSAPRNDGGLPQRERRRRDAAVRSAATARLMRTIAAVLPTRDDVLRARETIGDRLARTPLLPSRTHRCAPEVRAVSAHRLVQGARRAEQAQLAGRRGEAARRDRDQRGQPRPGRRLRGGRGERRRAGRDVAGRLRAEGGRDARVRRDRRPAGDRPRRRLRPPARADRVDRPHARAPVRRSGRDRRRGDGRARAARGCARRRRGDRRRRRGRADLRDPDRDRRPRPRRRRRAGDEHGAAHGDRARRADAGDAHARSPTA